ncbi:unnamed protein product [Closterium sp. NIES-53]
MRPFLSPRHSGDLQQGGGRGATLASCAPMLLPCTHASPMHNLSVLYGHHGSPPPPQDAILVNCSRGPVVDEVALVRHLKANPAFRAALDVFEDEPLMKPGLSTLPNVVVVPHIASASQWTRAGMAALAALNVAVS